MTPIKFGTDGWRGIIGRDFTEDNLIRVAKATARWIQEQGGSQIAVVGHDTRKGGEHFAETVATVLESHRIFTYISDGFVTTPMVSAATKDQDANAGIVITASHNPPKYNGYKLKSRYGGPTLPEDIARVEALIPNRRLKYKRPKLLGFYDLERPYLIRVYDSFDLDAIRGSGIGIAYDAMYGAGQNVVRKLFPRAALLHCKHDTTFKGQAPEPIPRNLRALARRVDSDSRIKFGLATDGDADRLGVFDEKGRFVDAHHLTLLLVHYLRHYKRMKGKVVVAFSMTDKVKKLCKHYRLPHVVTPIGFKHICRHMINDDVLLGGEESGGIAVTGHIPERDGVWVALLLLEFMAVTKKKLSTLLKEVDDIVGSFSYDRLDLHLTERSKREVMDRCSNGLKRFGKFEVVNTEDLDGYKFHLGDERWVMIRASGTEPLVRVYGEGRNPKEVAAILSAARTTLLS